ncbi:uncharacterized protein LOC108674539 isoform X2 [Hyalella azteca]|uniref:Uncharacterized protein LOC108674539 isoform X2 n=1 Tax=Hyalella azteca TaxID=294128 RepID=A0A979FNM3_HYAAZ|nr:uncharacterized protein LOC108674539 isoform X2 [Hyalella azteca]
MQQKNLQEVMGPNQMLPRKDGTEKSSGFTSLSGRTSQHKQSLGWSDAREEEVTLQPTHAEVAQPHQFASSQVEVTQASQFSSEQMHEPQKHDENGNTPEEESMADDDWYRKSDKPQSRDGFVLHHQEQMQQKRQELQQVLKEQMLQHEQTCQEEAPLPSCAMQQHLEEQQQQKMLAQQQRMRSFEDKLCRGELPPSSPGEKLSHEHNVDAPASNNAPSSQEREYQMRTSGNVSSEASANSSVTYDMDTTSVAMTASPIATSSPLIAPVSYANGSLSCGSSPHAAYPLSQSLGSSPHIPSTRPNFYTRGAPHPYYETRTMPDHQTRPMADHQTRPMLDRQTRPISDHQTRPMTDHQTRPMSDHQSHSISDHQTRPMSDHQARPMPDHQIRPMSDHQAHSMSDHQARPKPDHQTRPTPGHSFANNFQSPDASSHVIAGNTYTSGGNFHTSSGISYSSGGIPYASGINSLITGSFSHIPGTNARMFSSNSHVPATSGYGSAGHFDMLPSPPYLNPMMSANGSAATSLSSSTLNLMKKQITEIEREIALRKPDPSYVAGSSRHGDLPAGPVSSTLDLQLLDPLNDKMGEPPPPPAPHPHRGGGAILENGTLPQHKSSVLHSPHYTPTCDGALLLSSLGPITSPGLPPSGLPSSSAPPASGQDPSSCTAVNESAGHKRESVAAAIADIKQAIRRTKNLPLKSAADRNNVGPDTPVWVPRASRRSDGPVLGSPSDGPVPLSPTSSSGGTCNHVENGPARPDQRHDEDDGDTDQETDRLLGQQRAEDHGYGAPDKEKEAAKKKGRSKEVVVHEPAVLIEGVLFRARYLGSTQLVSEGQPTKTTRMMQAEEAVTRIKEAEDPDENMTMRKSDSESSTVKTTPSLLPRNASSDRTATTIRELSGVGMFPSGEVSAIICEPFESESCILQAEPNETNINLPQDDPAGDTRNSEDQDKENCTTNSSNELRDGLNDINDIDDDRDEVIDEENEEKTENDVMEHQEPVEQYNPPKYTSATYKPKSQYPQNRNIPEILRIQEELLPGEEKQTLHERFSKLQEFKNKSMVISALPRVSSSPSKKSISIPREYRRSPKQPLVYDADPYMLDSRFKTTHLWKTQAKISTGGIAGTSVITVPCDGKANLLGVKSAPLKSPLPPGVLEEPISPSRNKLDIHGQLLDFIEERNAAANSKLHKHLLHFLPDKKIKNLKERSGTQDELQMLTEPQPDEDGVMLYEEDSNDGMDRKLQEFDDDIIEEEEEEEEEDRKDNGTTANVGRAMAEDAENGNLADAIASVGRNGVRPSEALQHSPNTDISSDDNDFSEQDDNCNNKDTKNVRDLGDNCETDKDDDSATDVSYSRNDVGKKTDNEVRPPESRTRGSNIRQGSVGNVAWIVDGVGGIGATGTVFHLRLVGSVEVSEERCDVSVGSKNITTTASANPGKRPRKEMVTEAVSKLKALAPDGENQPNTEVDLFISTEKIMVLNTDLKEIMMDHALRTISYIADIGDLVVLMARRRMLPTDDTNSLQKQPKMICHVFESDEAQFIAQSIGQAFQVAYLEFLKANGIEDHSFVKEMDYQEVLNSQEIFGDELQMFAKKELQKEVVVPKMKSEILGVVVVESGWGSMVPTVVIANLSPYGAAAKCGQLNIGDQIIAINGVSLVGLPLSTCQNYIKNTKYNTAVKLTVVPCPPVVEVKIRRPDTKYQLGFSVQNGVICSLLRGGIAERGGVRVGHRIIDINSQSVVAVPHEKIVNLLATSVGEIRMKTMPTSIFRLLTGQETPQYI